MYKRQKILMASVWTLIISLYCYFLQHCTLARCAVLISRVKNANREASREVTCCYEPDRCSFSVLPEAKELFIYRMWNLNWQVSYTEASKNPIFYFTSICTALRKWQTCLYWNLGGNFINFLFEISLSWWCMESKPGFLVSST